MFSLFNAALIGFFKKTKYASSVGSSTGFYSVPPSIMKDQITLAPSGHYVTTYACDSNNVSLTNYCYTFLCLFYFKKEIA